MTSPRSLTIFVDVVVVEIQFDERQRVDFSSDVRVATRHHLRGPWWIPITVAAEFRGMWWAMRLHRAGHRLIGTTRHVS